MGFTYVGNSEGDLPSGDMLPQPIPVLRGPA